MSSITSDKRCRPGNLPTIQLQTPIYCPQLYTSHQQSDHDGTDINYNNDEHMLYNTNDYATTTDALLVINLRFLTDCNPEKN